jgi:putative membrane protein
MALKFDCSCWTRRTVPSRSQLPGLLLGVMTPFSIRKCPSPRRGTVTYTNRFNVSSSQSRGSTMVVRSYGRGQKVPGFWTSPDGCTTVTDDDDVDFYSKRKQQRSYDRDSFKESSRKMFRTVFDFENWTEHRATSRYMRHISGIFQSRLVYGLSGPLLWVACFAVIVAIGHELLNHQVFVIPDELKDILFINSVVPMSLTSSILGLLLVFRTNSSYSRWLDARKSWGLLVNRSRDLVRQGVTWLPRDERGGELCGALCRWVVALSYCLKCHLREKEDAVEKLRQLEILYEKELQSLSRVRNKPVYVMQVISILVRSIAETHPESRVVVPNMELNITQLEDVCGSCERILKTPIPLSYTRHTSRFMIVWLSLLPFALWDSCGYGMIPLTVAISLLTLGVEEIGVIIEEPFSVLPLERICATIASDIKEIWLYSEEVSSFSGEDSHPGT